jgi:hypothetical protein
MENKMSRFVTEPRESLKKKYLEKKAAVRIILQDGRRIANREDR